MSDEIPRTTRTQFFKQDGDAWNLGTCEILNMQCVGPNCKMCGVPFRELLQKLL